jgi:L-iditol 2-dehydrogenase
VLVGLGSSEMTLPGEHIQNLEITVTGIFRYTYTWPAGIHLVASGAVDLDSVSYGPIQPGTRGRGAGERPGPEQLRSIVYPNGYQEGNQGAAVRVRGRC